MKEEQYDELLNDFFDMYVYCPGFRFGQQFINFFRKHGYRLKDQDMSAKIFYEETYVHAQSRVDSLTHDDWEIWESM